MYLVTVRCRFFAHLAILQDINPLELLLAHQGVVILSGDLYHTRKSYINKLIPAFNASRADTLTSMARIDKILESTQGRLIVQHDPDDFAALPKFPEYLN